MMPSPTDKNYVLNDEERSYVVEALKLKIASTRRAINAQVSGSLLFKAHSEELDRVDAILRKFGA
jgi:hypothetical protein